MEFSIKTGGLEKQRTDCLILGVFESGQLSNIALEADKAAKGFLSQIVKSGDMDGKLGSTLLLQAVAGLSASRVLLVGLGKEKEFTEKHYYQAVKASIKALTNGGTRDVLTTLASLPLNAQSVRRKAALLAEATIDVSYRFDAIKQKKEETKKDETKKASKKGIASVSLWFANAEDDKHAKSGLADGQAIGAGVSLAKDLGNLPPNVCTPTYLADEAVALGKTYGFKVKVLERDELKKLGMGSFLAVSQGSEEPPKFIVMQHLKGKKTLNLSC